MIHLTRRTPFFFFLASPLVYLIAEYLEVFSRWSLVWSLAKSTDAPLPYSDGAICYVGCSVHGKCAVMWHTSRRPWNALPHTPSHLTAHPVTSYDTPRHTPSHLTTCFDTPRHMSRHTHSRLTTRPWHPPPRHTPATPIQRAAVPCYRAITLSYRRSFQRCSQSRS